MGNKKSRLMLFVLMASLIAAVAAFAFNPAMVHASRGRRTTGMLLILAVASVVIALAAFEMQVPVVNAGTLTSNVVANVIVSNTCFIGVNNPITFTSQYGGNVLPGIAYPTNVPVGVTDNGGNAAANILVEGTGGANALIGYWFLNGNTASSSYIGISNTLYSVTSQGSWTGTALTNSLINSGMVVLAPNTANPSVSNTLYFGLNVPSGQAAGQYIENALFQASCSANNPTAATQFIAANVGGVCYISLAPTAVSFGTLQPATNYNTNVVIVDTDNGGNAAATIFIQGTGGSGATLGYWQGPGTNTIPVGNTLWNPTTLAAYSGNALTNSLATTGITITAPSTATPSTSANVYLGLGVPGGTAGGTYVQNVLFENSC